MPKLRKGSNQKNWSRRGCAYGSPPSPPSRKKNRPTTGDRQDLFAKEITKGTINAVHSRRREYDKVPAHYKEKEWVVLSKKVASLGCPQKPKRTRYAYTWGNGTRGLSGPSRMSLKWDLSEKMGEGVSGWHYMLRLLQGIMRIDPFIETMGDLLVNVG